MNIVLNGGSFNPIHEGHFHSAIYSLEEVQADQGWFVFTNSPWKNPEDYAPLAERVTMGRIMAAQPKYENWNFVMSDIEQEIGSNLTYKVIPAIQKTFPEHHVIFGMGADNLLDFHKWEHSESIIETVPIVVVNRLPFTEAALNSPTATQYAHLRVNDPTELTRRSNGWCFLPKTFNMASRDLLKELRAGVRKFDGPFQAVADYIVEKRLYSVGAANAPQP